MDVMVVKLFIVTTNRNEQMRNGRTRTTKTKNKNDTKQHQAGPMQEQHY